MRRAAILALAVLATTGWAGSARAQETKDSPKDAEKSMYDFAQCVIGRSPRKADLDAYLRMSPNDPSYYKLGTKLAVSACVPTYSGTVKMTFQPVLFRFSLYEARYRREFAKAAPPDVTNAAPLDLAKEFDTRGGPLPNEVIFLRALGNCVVRADPATSHALVMSRAYSDEEATLIAALKPSLAGCIPAQATMHFSRTMLRGGLAEALYKFQPPIPAKVAK